MQINRCLAMGIVLALVGCTTVGPDFRKPDAPVQAKWLDADRAGFSPKEVDYRDWWQVFDDPVLDRLIRTAYEQNLTLRIAGLRIMEARAQLGVAVGNLYPQQQQGFGGYAHQKLSDNAAPIDNLPPFVARGVNTSFDDWALGMGASWELDFWGKFRRDIESADASLAATVADYDNVIVILTGDVATAYTMVRTFEERLEIIRRNVEIQRRSLKIAEVRFKNGAATELDVYQAQAMLYETESLIPRLQTGLQQSRNALATLLGMVPGEIDAVLAGPGRIPVPPKEIAVGVPADLMRRRPDIRSAELQAAAQSARIGLAKSELYPSLGLVANIGVQASDIGSLFSGGSLVGIINPAFKWNILNYGRIRNSVRVQDARFQRLAVRYQNEVLKAYQEVEDAMVGFLNAREEATSLAKSMGAGQRSVDLALLQYEDGTVTYTRVLTSQSLLVRVQNQWTAARGEAVTNLVAMYKALGGGWQIREGRPVIPEDMARQMAERTDWGRLIPTEVPAGLPEPPEPAGEQSFFQRPDW